MRKGADYAAVAMSALACLRKNQSLMNDARLFELLAYGAFNEAKARHAEVRQEKLAHSSAEERQILLRAQRLEWFFTQPFFVAEDFAGKKGVRVPLEKTIEGCRRILNGDFDAAEAEDMAYRGALAT